MQIRIRKEEENDFEIINDMIPKLMKYSDTLDDIYKTSEEIKGCELLQIPIPNQLFSKRENLIIMAKLLNQNNILLKEAEDILKTTKLTNNLILNAFKSHISVIIPTRYLLLERDFGIVIK